MPVISRGVAVAFHPHHIDHLAPWCAILDVPMLVCEAPGQRDAAQCYPGLKLVGMHDVTTPGGLAHMIDAVRELRPRVVLYSHLFDRQTLRDLFGAGRASPRIVHCPHGFSEKRQDYATRIAQQDVALLYGQHALDQLGALGVASMSCKVVLTGNVRRGYYLAHRNFFRSQLNRFGLQEGDGRRTILYAPTWNDAVGSSSFVSAFTSFAQKLPAGSRLVVKTHPHQEYEAAELDRLLADYRGRDDIQVLRNNPLTFPLLDMADVYVGDMSSLAYDFLVFDRPMYFLNQTAGGIADARESRLFRCGTPIDPSGYADIYSIIESTLEKDAAFSGARAELYRYTHAPGVSEAGACAQIAAACGGPAPRWLRGD
ncbi:MAG TPA: CDP-glycerol glycerophosphotransferase family protein [Casimicrobiaceae bacterium]